MKNLKQHLTSKILTIIMLTTLMISCSKDDSSTPPVNQVPGAFTLVAVPDNETGVSVLPTFTWNASTDPDGDTVSYDIYLDTDTSPNILVASGLNTATFTLVTKLDIAIDYYWKVIAKDGKGGETSSETFTFKSRPAKVTKIEPENPFDKRTRHSSLVYNNKMWVMGGSSKNDVWASSDGSNWEKIKRNDSNGFSKRNDHTSAFFLDKMWILGGLNIQVLQLREVWVSSNGVDWGSLVLSSNFPNINNHATVVFDDKMWILGGFTNNSRTSEVMNTSDGDIWTSVLANSSSIFDARSNLAAVVFDNKIWIIGGSGNGFNERFNDVWQSEDGSNWTQVTENANFSTRRSHQVVVFDDKMWLIGGHNGAGATNEVWYSKDGITWVDATPEDSFAPVFEHTSLVYNNKIWILGGVLNSHDVWTIE
jgi:dihydrofolate reductase